MTFNSIRPHLVPRTSKSRGGTAVLPWVKPGVAASLRFGTAANPQWQRVRVVRKEGDLIVVKRFSQNEWVEATVPFGRLFPSQPHTPTKATRGRE